MDVDTNTLNKGERGEIITKLYWKYNVYEKKGILNKKGKVIPWHERLAVAQNRNTVPT